MIRDGMKMVNLAVNGYSLTVFMDNVAIPFL